MPPPQPFIDLTWKDAEALDRGRTVAILPTGAVEAHGPHLPLGTDGVIARAMAEEGGRRLAAAGVKTVLLPALHYTAAPFAAGFPGTLSVRPETVTALVVDLAAALRGSGFRGLAIANAHLDPAHLGSLEEAVRQIEAGGDSSSEKLAVAFPNLARRRWAGRLTEEFLSGACHAGRYEGSIVLAARPELVRNEIRGRLPANPASLSTAIREGKGTFEEAGGPRAYFGAPAEATAEEGRETIRALGQILEESVLEALYAGPPCSAGDSGGAAGKT